MLLFRSPSAFEVNLGGKLSESQFAQLVEISALEEIIESGRDSFLRVDFAFPQTLLEVLRGKVNIYYLIGFGKNRIGQPFVDFNADKLFHSVVEALQPPGGAVSETRTSA